MSLNTLNISHGRKMLTISPEIFKGFTADFSSSNDFILNKEKMAFFNLSFSQDCGGISGNLTSTACSTFDVSFKYLALKKKLQIGISGSNIFNGIGSSYQIRNGVK